MQTAWIFLLKNSLRSFSTIIGLTVALTCTMFALLYMRSECTRFQYNRVGYPKQKKFDGKRLFPVPVMLYPAQPAGSHDEPEAGIE